MIPGVGAGVEARRKAKMKTAVLPGVEARTKARVKSKPRVLPHVWSAQLSPEWDIYLR